MRRLAIVLFVLMFATCAWADGPTTMVNLDHTAAEINQANATALAIRAANGVIISDGAGNILTAPTGALVPSGGTTGQVLGKISDTDYGIGWINQTGSGGSPGGEANSIQYNDGAGGFGGDANFKYDPATGQMTVPEVISNAADGEHYIAPVNTGDKNSPTEGMMWYNQTDKTYRYYDGTQMVDVPGAGGGGGVEGVTGTAPVQVDNTDPANPVIGFDTTVYTPASHATDTANPHQVTAAQVGAPASTQVGNIIISTDCAAETGVQYDLCFQAN